METASLQRILHYNEVSFFFFSAEGPARGRGRSLQLALRLPVPEEGSAAQPGVRCCTLGPVLEQKDLPP